MQDLSNSVRFRLLVLGLFGLFAFTYFHQFFVAKATYPILGYLQGGGDFPPFYFKAKEVLAGQEMFPSLVNKPPLFIVLLIPLIEYGSGYAARALQFITLALMLLGMILFCRQSRQGFWVSLCVVGCLSTSWAFGFLIDRANADGVSMGLSAFSVVAVAAQMPFLGWALFALAVNIKSNVLPLALPLILAGRISSSLYRGVWFGVAAVTAAALTPRWSLEWFEIASHRVGMRVNMDQSTSIFPAWMYVFYTETLATRFLVTTTCLIVVGIIFQTWYNKRSNPLLGFTLLVPCTYAYPALTYPYSMVLFPLLLLTYGFSSNQGRFASIFFGFFSYVGALGLIVQSFPMFYWQKFLSDPRVMIVPSFGVSLTLLANAVIAWSPGLHMNAFQSAGEGGGNRYIRQCGNAVGMLILGLMGIIAACVTFNLFTYPR